MQYDIDLLKGNILHNRYINSRCILPSTARTYDIPGTIYIHMFQGKLNHIDKSWDFFYYPPNTVKGEKLIYSIPISEELWEEVEYNAY